MPVPKNNRTDNPFTDHDDEKEKPNPTREEAVERVETKDERPNEKVVSVDPPDADDDEDEREPTPRQQRRRERYDNMAREKQAAEERAQRAEQFAAALQAQHMASQQQQKPTDPFDDEKKKLEDDWMKHLALADTLAKGSTADQQAQWKRDHLALQERQQTLVTKRMLAEAGFAPGQRVNIQAESMKAHLAMAYADVVGNNQYLAYADGLERQFMAVHRRAPTLQDYEKIMNDTRRAFRLPTAPTSPPSEETRRKFSGGGLGGANGSGGGSRQITMTKAEMKMAEAMYKVERDPKTGKTRRLRPEESHAKWAQRVGKRLVEQRRASG